MHTSKPSVAIVALGLFLLSPLALGQTPIPPDVDPDSLSRLPLIDPNDLDAEGRRIYDMVRGTGGNGPMRGPRGISMYSPRVAEAMHLLNEYLRREGVLEDRHVELAVLVTAREFDQHYEWRSHEAAAIAAGVDARLIDAIRNDASVDDVDAFDERDRTLIRFGRALFEDHRVSPELYRRVVELFGEQGMFEITAVMGDYAMAALMLNAVNHQLPDGATSTLPPRGR